MIISNPKQYETLYNLVEGNDKPVDGRTVNALRRRGLVDSFGHATTSGWNAIGRFRFVPLLEIPRDVDIETYRDTCVGVIETANEYRTDNLSAGLFGDAPRVFEYYVDSYILLKWYQQVRLKEQEFLESNWSLEDDLCYGLNDMTKGYLYGLLREATVYGLDHDQNIYTKHIFYEIASKLSTHNLSIGSHDNRSLTSFKYSLQDNEDELARFQWRGSLLHPPGHRDNCMKFIWMVNID